MDNCIHQIKKTDKIGQCDLLPEDIDINFSSICLECQKHWQNNVEPTKDNLTPILKIMTKSSVVSYTESTTQHIANGLPELPEKDYQKRLDICKSCEEYTSKNTCKLCGCKCGGGSWFFSKLRRPHEECPLKKW